ncbi:MAG: type II secretion system protein [Candidatus Marinimicrobia bacterium]|nr:type II secretion system protein [Candidatus Neomarinimicrobiota bacterium]MCF7830169.1 type II secretion system protein [Candidatus Neomarinimicrobiota bacterium]MCF7882097.1 type II secretion system protein [Candidatus Neomarinimicrobiota bacterium]
MRNTKGFTLIELVMVIVILGILAAVAIPRFSDLSTNARTSSFKGAIGAVKSSVVSHLGNTQEYPAVEAFTTADSIFTSDDFSITDSDPSGSLESIPATPTFSTAGGNASETMYLIDGPTVASANYYVTLKYEPTSGTVYAPTNME